MVPIPLVASLSGNIAVLNHGGQIIAVSDAWNDYRTGNGGALALAGLGTDYLQVCDDAASRGDLEAARSAVGIRAVLDRQSPRFVMEYVCAERWYQLTRLRTRRWAGGCICRAQSSFRMAGACGRTAIAAAAPGSASPRLCSLQLKG
jgi:hypothetical protein